jgi:hypothetical protein
VELFSPGAAKRVGAVLIVIGCIGLAVSWNMDTTLEAGGERIGSREFGVDVPKTRVHNIGLMDERRNYMLLSALALVVGVITVGFGALAENQATASNRQVTGSRCPKCSGMLEGAPTVCMHCRTELRWVDGKVVTAEEARSLLEKQREQGRIQEERRKQREKEFEERREQQVKEFKASLQSLVSEFRQIYLTTVQQTGRLLTYAKAWSGGYRLTALQAELRFRLGRSMFQFGVGDPGLVNQIAELTGQIASPSQKMLRSWLLKRERRRLTIRLADNALGDDSPPNSAETGFREAKIGEANLNAACEHRKALRGVLLPADGTEWRRVGMGCGLTTLVIFVMLFLLLSMSTAKTTR